MTKKENYLLALEHKKPESIPFYGAPVRYSVGFRDVFEKGPVGGGFDGYGVRWETTTLGNVPDVTYLALTDITKWKEQITFPNLDEIDWEAKAKAELAAYNPEESVIDYAMGNGPFERLLAFMGYEHLIEALIDEPEACHDLIDKWVDERLHFVDLVCKHYHPDFITVFDDVAFEGGPFLTMDLYEEFIMPAHLKVNEAILAGGARPINHCCGKAEKLIEHFIAEKGIAWTSCQPMNDIASLLEKYHDQITIIGGYNSNGAPSHDNATDEERYAEAKRAIDEYAKWGSFILGNAVFMDRDPQVRLERLEKVTNFVHEYGDHYYERNNLL